MVNHKCPKCDKSFAQKGHLEAHLKRKKTCEKCNVNFSTQFFYVNEEPIHIDKYKKGMTIKCQKGHELVMCDGLENRKHFRHKNTEDVGGSPMTEWHSFMQSFFARTEHPLQKINENQTKNRRVDAFVKEHNFCIEIQHSPIDEANVICRNSDYSQHNVKALWIIDGNTKDVVVDHLSTGNYLITLNDAWKYKSFRHTYDYILLEVDTKMFKIPVKRVCNKMILVREWKPIDPIMDILRTNPKKVWDEWEDDNEIKAKLVVQQKGAGNGKTFGIWKSIANNQDKELFIVVTKQHSAKTVIKKELDAQAERNEYHIVENLNELHSDEHSRKHIIQYQHNHSKRNCIVIISTIDSFIYNLTENYVANADFFRGLLESINEYGTTKVNKESGCFKYAGKTLHLDKKAEIWIDEAQDLNEMYFKAITRLMLETNTDVVIVGDKLQSLEYRDNLMTLTEEKIPNINIIRETPVNYNRRIEVDGMASELNKLIDFKKYQLPSIEVHDPKEQTESVVLDILDAPTDRKNHGNFIKRIIEKVDTEVKLHGYSPKDFLFVFAVMKSNYLADELETKLNEYWIDKKMDDDADYAQYAVLHKHEPGQVIDMSLSEEATRIVSIRTSKGDGRNIVFCLGINEATLKLVSRNDQDDLIYDSYLHVALTRAKKKIFFGLEKNNDEIHRRFGSKGLVEFRPIIRHNIQHDKIIEYINNDKIVEILKNIGIEDQPETDVSKVDETKEVIDWEYHCMRRAVYLQYAVFNILKHKKVNKNTEVSQINTILSKICKLPICRKTPKDFYEYLKKQSDEIQVGGGEFEYFPLCNLSHKKEIYKKYYNEIKRKIEENNKRIKEDKLSIASMNPLDAVIQWYTIELFTRKKYCQTKPTTIYNIHHNFRNENNTKLTRLISESKEIEKTATLVLENVFETNESVEWNIEHMIQMEGRTKQINIWNRDIPLIGYGKNNVYHFMFETDFNRLNYWNVMLKMMVERFIIFHSGGNDNKTNNNKTKFNNKKISTYLFILKKSTYKKFTLDDKLFSSDLRKVLSSAVIKHFCSFNIQLFKYCKIITKSDKWKKFGTPFLYIVNEFEKIHTVPYVTDFFKYLHYDSNENQKRVKQIINSEEIFCQKLTERIENMCNTFFDLIEDTDTKDVEW